MKIDNLKEAIPNIPVSVHNCLIRNGCIRYEELADFPKYRELYIRTFDRMIEERKRRKLSCQWECGEEVFFRWMEDQNVKGQMELSEFIQY